MGGSDEIANAASPIETDRQLAVCLVSGGMDSCVTAAIAHKYNNSLAFLHASYGQLTEERERRAFEQLSDHYGVENRLVISLQHIGSIGGSSLTDSRFPVTTANLNNQEIPTSYVPFRNAHLLSAATSWAEVLHANSIYIGAVAEDSSGYPDCRPEFYDAFQQVVDLGTKPSTKIEIRTPVIGMKKAEIVQLGQQLQAPLHLTWSCYQQSEIACGHCDSCALRLRAFREAGIKDPIAYQLDSSRSAY
jgi:7-cyano-7-deazaguanine synthase